MQQFNTKKTASATYLYIRLVYIAIDAINYFINYFKSLIHLKDNFNNQKKIFR